MELIEQYEVSELKANKDLYIKKEKCRINGYLENGKRLPKEKR